MVALSTPVVIGLIVAAVAALGFTAGIVALVLRRRPPAKPDIPPGMRPGPADEMLERRFIERFVGWNLVFVLLFAVWIPLVWLREPETNAADAVDLTQRSVERGEMWFAVAGAENPTGFGCARCHGEEAEGGETPFMEQAYPVPPLNNVCGRLTIEGPGQIRDTIMQGREGTPMPSWSVRFEGAMNDQQIQDLINYLLTIQTVEGEDNLCLNPPTDTGDGTQAQGQ